MQNENVGKKDFYLLISLMVFLTAIAPLYIQENLGGRGLELTFNLAIWPVAVLIICCALFLVTIRREAQLPRYATLFVAVPVVIILSSFITGMSQPSEFFFREVYVLCGLFFFFALFQFKLSQRQLEWVLLAVALSSLPHGVIGVLQIHAPITQLAWFPSFTREIPYGVFQQINVQISFLATAIAILFYLLSRPIANRLHWSVSALVVFLVGINTHILVYSGSRVGLLSLVLSLLLLMTIRYKQLSKNKLKVLLVIIAMMTGLFFGKDGMVRSFEKSMNLTQGVSREARVNMYRIAFELVVQKPVQGHGVGNFLRVWNLQTADYFSRNPDATLPPYTEHPHNELVFWIIEGGIVIIGGILAALVAVILGLIRCGPKRAAGYVAMLLPITIHASLHWFLWLFLIFVVMRHQQVKHWLSLTIAGARLIQITSVTLLLGCWYFLYHSDKAQTDITNFIRQKPSDTPYLEVALNNYYFRPYAEELAMRNRLYSGINSSNNALVQQYIDWVAQRISVSPELKLFEDLITAYDYQKNQRAKCEIIYLGLSMYPYNMALVSLQAECKK
jgi:O-antigen polymerase